MTDRLPSSQSNKALIGHFEGTGSIPLANVRAILESATDVRKAERDAILARLVEMADALDQDEVARTAETLRRAAAILDFEGGR